MAILKYFFTLCLTLVFTGLFSNAYAAGTGQGNADLAIWNPKSVDWWVAASGESDDLCQIHWVYDDEVDVYLKKNAENLYYFGVEYIGGTSEMQKFFQKGDFEAIFIVDEKQVKLDMTRLGANKLVAKASWAVNSLEYLRQGDALFLKSEDALYSFPLENSAENYDVYYQCLKDNGQYIERSAPIEIAELPNKSPTLSSAPPPQGQLQEPQVNQPSQTPSDSNYAPDGFSLLFGNNPEQQAALAQENQENNVPDVPAPAPVKNDTMPQEISNAAQQGNDLESPKAPEPMDVSASALEKESMVAAKVIEPEDSKVMNKAKDFLGSELNYIEDEDVSASRNGDSTGAVNDDDKACGNEVGENITGVIENLTRKLTILEREKETLRLKLIASGSDPVLSDLLACKTSGIEEQAMLEASSGAIEEYKILIESMRAEVDELRAENELLNSSVANAPRANAASIPEMAKLRDEVNQLKNTNLQLNREIEEFKNIIDQEADAEENKEVPDAMPLSEVQQRQVDDVLSEELDWDEVKEEIEQYNADEEETLSSE